MTQIWWCEKHRAESKGAFEGKPHTQCWRAWSMRIAEPSCSLVPMRLIPDDAETVKWCAYHNAEVVDLIAGTCWDVENRHPCSVVDAFVTLLAPDGETP